MSVTATRRAPNGRPPSPQRNGAARLGDGRPRNVSSHSARRDEVVGTFCGQEEVLVTPELDGRVVKVHHDLGDVVHVGDVLIEIDPTDFRLAVDEIAESIGVGVGEGGIGRFAQGRFRRESASLGNSRKTWNRTPLANWPGRGSLHERRIGPQDELDQTETDYPAAVADWQQTVMDAQAVSAMARHKYALLQTAEKHLRDTAGHGSAPATVPHDQCGKGGVFGCAADASEGGDGPRGTPLRAYSSW